MWDRTLEGRRNKCKACERVVAAAVTGGRAMAMIETSAASDGGSYNAASLHPTSNVEKRMNEKVSSCYMAVP
jgi:hypothetical protein